MDVGNLAINIAALYTTCRDGYNFFTTVRTAASESSVHLRELEIQQSILKAWGFHWQIQSESGSEPEHSHNFRRRRTRLDEYLLNNRFKAEGVFSILSALADTLSDQEKLSKRYGIQFRPIQAMKDESETISNVQLAIPGTTIKQVKPVVNEVKNRLSVLNRFRWALKDKDNFRKLIADLRSHSDSLYRLCPEYAFEAMNIFFTWECLAGHESPAGLKLTSSLAARQAEVDGKSSMREPYALLALTANLKASINENKDKEEVNDMSLTGVDEKQSEMRYLGKGLALFEKQVVYVETRDYRGPPLELTAEQNEQAKLRDRSEAGGDVEPIEIVRPADPKLRAVIRNFYSAFHGPNMMGNVYGLDMAGIIDHTEGEHKGHCSILYKLPGSMGVQSRGRPAENLKLRAPVTLQSLLGNRESQRIRSTLGSRFELARKLVRAVCLLHSSGWLHKNIRAESVIFFPDHVIELQENQYGAEIKIDVSKPILMGYIFSRPDDIIIRRKPTSAPQKDDDIDWMQDLTRPSVRGPTTVYKWKDPRNKQLRLRRREGTLRPGSVYGRDMPGEIAVIESEEETNISGFTLDYYQHPAKHADPERQYRHAYDVYSLGILLLEVGLWEKLQDYDVERGSLHSASGHDEEDQYERRRWVCRKYLDRLRWQCGDTYADVVLSCLMIDSSDDELDKASERELCARLVADLEGCQA
ncbi:hypothetical protein MKX07_002781 [Trichoderma sp. CBMAI-0711]|nr:hypothetical protein MKX07_002781 [Trichoderma sp. CBMAI-0711]